MSGKPPTVVALRQPVHVAETALSSHEDWEQARIKAVAGGAVFAMLICEDGEGAVFLVPVNVASNVHQEGMVLRAVECFEELEEV